MSKEVWIGKKGFRYWYYRLRDSEYYSLILIGFTVLICLMLIFGIIMPQLTNWFSIRQETIATRERIAVLQNNINYLNNLDRNKVAANVDTVTSALPIEKDFSAMLAVVSDAAISSNVAMNDFTFQVGAVTGSKVAQNQPKNALSSVRLTLVVVGSMENVKRFINKVESSVPVAEVVNIDGTDQAVAISIQFYQKDFPDIKVNDDKQLEDLPAEKLAILQKLQSMKKPLPVDFGSSSASGGGIPLF